MAHAEVMIPPDADCAGIEQQPACLVEPLVRLSEVTENDDPIDSHCVEPAQRDPKSFDVFMDVCEEAEFHGRYVGDIWRGTFAANGGCAVTRRAGRWPLRLNDEVETGIPGCVERPQALL